MERRPLESRNTVWAQKIARWLTQKGVRPNAVSVMSMVFALMSGVSFGLSGVAQGGTRSGFLFLAALMVQLRLACNLFDGMIAVEGGLKSKAGEIYNDAPDRVSDVLILLGASLAIRSFDFAIYLGWAAALLAVFTAYVRVLGTSCGTKAYFSGPMAKPHRMATVTLAALVAIGEDLMWGTDWALLVSLGLITVGAAVTSGRRILQVTRELESRS